MAALHSELLKESVLKDFYEMWPERFGNVTNGVTPRRFLALSNPGLRALLDETIGPGWLTDMERLHGLESFVDDPSFRQRWRDVKRANKSRLAEYVHSATGIELDPTWMFDVQVKRIHEYKRQHLNLLNILAQYKEIRENPQTDRVPRVFLFGAKAAPGYYLAKNIIWAINKVAAAINNDPLVGDKLKVVFIPNYSVSLAQLIIPAADLSEQISLAGTEASGTSNMKFALNGALTIGTLDGANVEMQEHVGADNFFIFGNTAEEVEALRANGYKPRDYYEQDEELHQALTQIGTGLFSPSEPGRYRDLLDSLINFGDHYQVLADYRSYVDCQDKVDELYRHPEEWANKAMLNIANMGYFSSDRTIKEYADHIWHIDPVRL